MKTNWGTGIDMTPRTTRTTVIALIISAALPAWGQQYLLYSPHPVTLGDKASAQEGILVQEVKIRKGDTLSALSRKFRGRGAYFPQILLFNEIKNPNLIYAGKTLRIPVSKRDKRAADRSEAKAAAASSEPKTSPDKELHPITAAEPLPTPAAQQHASPAAAQLQLPAAAERNASTPPPALEAEAGPRLFEAAVKAYRRDDCRTALELLDRYLADNSGSPLAADANLYKAECYLKLSAQ